MQRTYQQKLWASFFAYAVAFSVLLISVNPIFCENEAHALDEQPNSGSSGFSGEEDPTGVRYVRYLRAAPLRWGKRNIDKRSTGENDDGTSEDVIDERNTRASPLRWGKRMQSDKSLMRPVRATPLRWGKRSVDSQLFDLYNKRAPLRWGKRAPSRFGKRAPMRFGKREEYKRAPMRFGKRSDSDLPLDFNDVYYPQIHDSEWNNDYGTGH